jgi:GT2 family glycosyltransferase
MLSVIMINYKTPVMTEKAVRNFVAQERNLDYEIILIDNESKGELEESRFDGMKVEMIRNKKNIGFAKAVNQGLKKAKGEYVLLLNSDVIIEQRAISKMIKYMELDKNIGVIGPLMLYPDGRFQVSAGRFPTLAREFLRLSTLYRIFPGSTLLFDSFLKPIDISQPRQIDWVSGGAMLIRGSVLEEISGLDEGYFLGVEDIDYCYRAKKNGWKVVYFPLSKVFHFHGFSSGKKATRSILRIKCDRNGFNYFFRKFYPGRKVSRKLVNFMHDMKIFVFKILNKRSEA